MNELDLDADQKLCDAATTDRVAWLNLTARARTALPQYITRVRELEAERDRLAAIVEKLPKTADGLTLVPGMTVYRISQSGSINVHEVDLISEHGWHDDDPYPHHGPIYSSRAAADAAAKEKP